MRVRVSPSRRSKGRSAGLLLASASLMFAGVGLASPANAQSTPTLRLGDGGECVTYVQKKIGGVRVDGIFGEETRRGVMDFERRRGLVVNGVVGGTVWKLIGPCPAGEDHPTPPPPPSGSCSYDLGRTHADVEAAACEIGRKFSVKTIYGHRNTGSRNCDSHQNGRAIDVMVYRDKAKGDAIGKYVMDNHQRLRVSYIIWYQRIWSPSRASEGWRYMANRGSDTANHKDHPHISFKC